MKRNQLINHLNKLLEVNLFKDYCPNGLQIEGHEDINNICIATTASLNVINQTIDKKADTLIVHHGYFWKNENPVISQIKKKRIKNLLMNNINLIAYHLPLDMHGIYGNNIRIANLLGISNIEYFNICLIGNKKTNMSDVINIIHTFSKTPLILNVKNDIDKIAICSGGGQNYFEKAIELGADLFITGESNEQAYHLANEYNVNFIAAGHHNTETFGIKALGDYIQKTFQIPTHFINENNPC